MIEGWQEGRKVACLRVVRWKGTQTSFFGARGNWDASSTKHKGVSADGYVWMSEVRGIPLSFRLTVATTTVRRTICESLVPVYVRCAEYKVSRRRLQRLREVRNALPAG